MPALGALSPTRIGPGGSDGAKPVGVGSAVTYAMASLNTGWCARFQYQGATGRDVKSVYVNFSSVSSPGTVQCRIETIDATTGKPTGTLYDAAATKDFTPAAGWNTVTFDTTPSAHLTSGTCYGIVLLTTVAGTTMTARSHVTVPSYPNVVLTAADGTTRSNFAEVANSNPICTLLLTDGATDVEELQGCVPYAVGVSNNVYGTIAVGAKLILAVAVNALGVAIDYAFRSGSPADVRCKILDSSDVVVTDTTIVIDKDNAITGSRILCFLFPSIVALAAGTYRIVFDQTDHGTGSSDYWRIYSATARSSAVLPTGFRLTSTANIDGSPISWSDSATDLPLCALLVDSLPAGAGGGGIIRNNMSGGMVL